jgi:chromate transport protein ChrA
MLNDTALRIVRYSKLLLGSTGSQAIANLGHKLGGWSGSAVAMAAFMSRSTLMMVLMAAGYVVTAALAAFGPSREWADGRGS